MKRPILLVTLPICLTILCAVAYFGIAGDLSPPAGVIAPTMKTLLDIEPRIAVNAANTPGDADSLFKIIQPGSYYLTGNITGAASKHGIEIAASGVTLDLGGFEMSGVAGSLDGITCTLTNANNLAVNNGTVRGWNADGIDFRTASALNGAINKVRASDNSGEGIRAGFSYIISACAAYSNDGAGLSSGAGCTFDNCSAYLNSNGGIAPLANCTLSDCSAYLNSGVGISVTSSTIIGCNVAENTGDGINGSNATIVQCNAWLNAGNGISAGAGTTITKCSATENGLDGIRVNNACVVRENLCHANGNVGSGANIHAASIDNRIEGNNCIGADRGIDVDGTGNIIVRNSCSGATTNWDVVAGNVILVVNAVTSGAVTGNTGGFGPGSTDPNANFTY